MYTESQIRALIAADNLAEFYNDKYWRRLSHKIIAEAHHECQMCRQEHKLTPATLVHHVKHLRAYPALAYSRTYMDETGEHMQLMPLCHDCHDKIHARGIYAAHTGFSNEEKW